MAKAFSRINGWPVAVGIVRDFLAMAAAFKAQFGVELTVTSGIRTYTEQVEIFTQRYTPAPNGRRVYDTRRWNGQLWYRISGAGTVAQPGTSNHETGRSLDLADTGSDAGVASSFGSPRNRWLSQNCWRWGFTHTGTGFAEPWHFEQLRIADPFLGRGKPNSISSNDPGEPIGGAAGGGGDEDEMNSSQEKKLDDALRFAKAAYEKSRDAERWTRWLKARIKGSTKQKSLTVTTSEARDAAQWLKVRTKGSVKQPSITALLESIVEAVVSEKKPTRNQINARAVEIDKVLVTDADVPVPEIDEVPPADTEE